MLGEKDSTGKATSLKETGLFTLARDRWSRYASNLIGF